MTTIGDQSINREEEEMPVPCLIPGREECVYTSHYCEENVWKLCHSVSQNELHHFFVLFISNPVQKIPLWKQKAGDESSDYLVVWDYHVILIYKSCDEEYWVYDQDSVLSFPCPFPQYWRLGIRADAGLRPDFHRHFRLIPAAVFLTAFASDRSHMRSPVDGSWLRPPPDYPCIRTPETSNNLDSFISMRSEVGVGTIFQSSEALREYFSRSVA